MIDAGLSDRDACQRIFLVDVDGLLTDETADLSQKQRAFSKSQTGIDGWTLSKNESITLLDVVTNVRPTAQIGVSGQTGAFSENVVRRMGAGTKRPVILPLSNPTSCSEATPTDLLSWTAGRVVIRTGSPFPPIVKDGQTLMVDQTNNTYFFPGMVLGAIACEAKYISDGMFVAAAKALAAASPAINNPRGNLLPPISSLREVSVKVACAVAWQAQIEGLAKDMDGPTLESRIRGKQWSPHYSSFRWVRSSM